MTNHLEYFMRNTNLGDNLLSHRAQYLLKSRAIMESQKFIQG